LSVANRSWLVSDRRTGADQALDVSSGGARKWVACSSCNEGVGGVRPFERPSVLVVVGDEREELGDEVVSRREVAVGDDLALQDREEQLD
jgi:hypothetical protein